MRRRRRCAKCCLGGAPKALPNIYGKSRIFQMSKQGLPTEFELIARYFAPLAREFPGAYGLLDDAAVISPASGNELVVKTDSIVGGIDFLPDEPADLVARKALRVNLSDLAAKGAVPRAYLLDLVLPNTVDESVDRAPLPPVLPTTKLNTVCI